MPLYILRICEESICISFYERYIIILLCYNSLCRLYFTVVYSKSETSSLSLTAIMVLPIGFITVCYLTSTLVNDINFVFVQNLDLVYIDDILKVSQKYMFLLGFWFKIMILLSVVAWNLDDRIRQSNKFHWHNLICTQWCKRVIKPHTCVLQYTHETGFRSE